MKSIDIRGEKSSSDSEGMNKTEYQKVAEFLRLYNVFFIIDWS